MHAKYEYVQLKLNDLIFKWLSDMREGRTINVTPYVLLIRKGVYHLYMGSQEHSGRCLLIKDGHDIKLLWKLGQILDIGWRINLFISYLFVEVYGEHYCSRIPAHYYSINRLE